VVDDVTDGSREATPGDTTWLQRHSRSAPFALGFGFGIAAASLVVGLAIPGYIVGRAGLRKTPAVLGIVAGFAGFLVWLVVGLASAGCPSCGDGIVVFPVVVPFLLVPFQAGYWLGRRAPRRSPARATPNRPRTARRRIAVAVAWFAVVLLADVVILAMFRSITGLRPSDVAGAIAPPGSLANGLIGAVVILGPPLVIAGWRDRRTARER
jgi:hypothetical protein